MKAEITAEHAWLRRLVGEWTSEMVSMNGEPQPAGTMPGRETVRALGEVWILAEGRGQAPDGTPVESQMLLGFDPQQGAFVGSWIGSMMNHLWVYRAGALDAAQRVLALNAEGPAFDGTPGSMAQYRDEIEIVAADERLLHGNVQREDGSWSRFMTVH